MSIPRLLSERPSSTAGTCRRGRSSSSSSSPSPSSCPSSPLLLPPHSIFATYTTICLAAAHLQVTMATAKQTLSAGLERIQQSVDGGASAKLTDLQRDSKNVFDSSNRITTDFGVRQNTTGMSGASVTGPASQTDNRLDDWLKVHSEDHTGPMLLEDHAAREKINRFDHERIPERVVHARGSGAFGTFKLHTSLEQYTTAKVLTDTSRATPTFVRFSTVLGSRGSADTVRDVRGFSIKHYTPEGNWDVVGNNIPGTCREVYCCTTHSVLISWSSVLHPGRDQIPRRDSCRQARAAQRGASSTVSPQQLLGFSVPAYRGNSHVHVASI